GGAREAKEGNERCGPAGPRICCAANAEKKSKGKTAADGRANTRESERRRHKDEAKAESAQRDRCGPNRQAKDRLQRRDRRWKDRRNEDALGSACRLARRQWRRCESAGGAADPLTFTRVYPASAVQTPSALA